MGRDNGLPQGPAQGAERDEHDDLTAAYMAGFERGKQAARERGAALVREMKARKPYSERPWVRLALSVAANAVERGRFLTDVERLNNLDAALAAEGGAGIAAADPLSATSPIPEGEGLPQPMAGAAEPTVVMVPVDPTDEMVAAGPIDGWDDHEDESSQIGHAHTRESIYQAMIAARPRPDAPLNTAAERDVLAERRRQIAEEGWTPEHDDRHHNADLARAAACYAYQASFGLFQAPDHFPMSWPWSAEAWKPKEQRADLVRAAALIFAEIERLDRAASTPPIAREGSHGE